MPPRRNSFWAALTGGNPLAGQDPHAQYRTLRWGNEPRRNDSIEVPGLTRRQAVVELGRLRKLFVADAAGREYVIAAPRPYPHLCVGAADNKLYYAGGSLARMARARMFGLPGTRWVLLRTDYDANKGGDDVYWYHDHEPPYPALVVLPSGYPVVRGGRYHVEEGGIVG